MAYSSIIAKKSILRPFFKEALGPSIDEFTGFVDPQMMHLAAILCHVRHRLSQPDWALNRGAHREVLHRSFPEFDARGEVLRCSLCVSMM